MSLLEKRIKKYESKFGVRVLEVQKYERMKKGAPGSKAARNRAAYIARHSKIKLANGRKAINVVGPSSLSLIILW